MSQQQSPRCGTQKENAAGLNIPANAWVIGLDYGNTTTSAGFVNKGDVQVIEFENSLAYVSSDVALPARDPTAEGNQYNYPDVPQVGATRGRACQYPDAMVTQNKLFLGSMYDDDVVQNKIKDGSLITPLAADPTTRETMIKLPNGDVYSLEEVMGYVVKYVLNRVREKLGVSEQDAPIYVQCAIPAQFAGNTAYLQALAKGVESGGGYLLPTVVPEPTAAAVAELDAIARQEAMAAAVAAAAATTTTTTATTTTTTPQQHKMDEHSRVLVIDLGGGTSDIALFQVGRHNELQFMPQCDGIAIGGNDYTNAIAHYLITTISNNNIAHPYNIDVPFAKKTSAEQRLWEELLANVEAAKRELQQTVAVDVLIPLSQGDYTGVNLTAREFATATEDLTNKCLAKIRGLLKKCGNLSTADITHVVMTGGGANVVSIQDAVRGMFNHKHTHFSIGQYGVALQESVVRGAALLAAQYATRPEQRDLMVSGRPQLVDQFTPGPAAVLELMCRVVEVSVEDAAEHSQKMVKKLTDESNKALQWWWYDLPKICVDSTCAGVMALSRGLMTVMKCVMSLFTFCILLCLSFVLPATTIMIICNILMLDECNVLKFVDILAIVKQIENKTPTTWAQQNAIFSLVVGVCFAIYFGRAIWSKLIKWSEELAQQEHVLSSEEIARLKQLVADLTPQDNNTL